jgi:GT2 family glycosyltransferase
MPSLTISVIICVYTERRWDQIRAAIDSVRTQTLPAMETIVVVDHNPGLYKRLVDVESNVMVVENREEQGLSGGRNTGAALAKGEIIAFLDDDAAADPDWLKYLAEGYDNPDVKGVGGLALPDWQTARPSWMPEEFYWVVGCNYRGMAPSGVPVRNLIGSNMSFRREAFDLVEGFQTGIGRNADSLPLGCEETLFCIRLGQRSPGSLFVMDHRAKVRHYVTAAVACSPTSSHAAMPRASPRHRSPRMSGMATGWPPNARTPRGLSHLAPPAESPICSGATRRGLAVPVRSSSAWA